MAYLQVLMHYTSHFTVFRNVRLYLHFFPLNHVAAHLIPSIHLMASRFGWPHRDLKMCKASRRVVGKLDTLDSHFPHRVEPCSSSDAGGLELRASVGASAAISPPPGQKRPEPVLGFHPPGALSILLGGYLWRQGRGRHGERRISTEPRGCP